ncbi:MAG TPA: hypothetical protein PKL96_03250 [Bacteroidales bacterium]|nr:hypothetical protein [Bacteroidales bacterium]HPS27064.1 hypothetical protein [Bacteroidales bacterium]
MEKELTVGTRVDHERYGEGVVSKVNISNYEIIFTRGGKMEFSKSNKEIEVIEYYEGQIGSQAAPVDLDAFEQLMIHFLDKYGAFQEVVPMGEKWEGGKLILQPGKEELKPKEIPIEAFFHKIVMLRDRLRVLEQNINSHPQLSDQDKVNMQQYITRIYGSLTTFNILFEDKDDYFVGTGGGN